MRILVCENNADFTKDFENCLAVYSGKNKDIEYMMFSSLERMNSYLSLDPEQNHIYIIEFSMVCDDPVDHLTTLILHKRDPQALIILSSNVRSSIERAFELCAYRFLLKPFVPERFYALLDQTIDQLKTVPNNFMFTCDRKLIILYVHDIMYFEKSKRSMKVFTESEFYRFNMSQKNALDSLDADTFIPTSASFIVNLEFVNKVNREAVTLSNTLIIPITRNYRQNFMKAYKAFVEKYTFH